MGLFSKTLEDVEIELEKGVGGKRSQAGRILEKFDPLEMDYVRQLRNDLVDFNRLLIESKKAMAEAEKKTMWASEGDADADAVKKITPVVLKKIKTLIILRNDITLYVNALRVYLKKF